MKRGKNSWLVSATHNGQRYRVTIHDKSKMDLAKQVMLDAMRNGKNIEDALVNADLFSRPDISIDAIYTQVVKKYWSDNDNRQVGNGKQIVNFFGPKREIGTIDENCIDEMLEFFEDSGNSDATINRKLAALSKMFTFAKIRKHITHVPHIEWRKEGKGRLRYLTEEEEVKLVSILKHTQHDTYLKFADAVQVLIDTGLRRSELRRGRQSNLHKGVWSHYDTKNDLSRSIPLTERCQQILYKYGNQEFPFQDLSDSQIRRCWDYAKSKMGLADDKQFVLHALRHTCASRLVQRGIQILVVKEWLGHKSLSMTLRYAHLAPDNLQEAVKVLEQRAVAS